MNCTSHTKSTLKRTNINIFLPVGFNRLLILDGELIHRRCIGSADKFMFLLVHKIKISTFVLYLAN
jgi:hypothetical protein